MNTDEMMSIALKLAGLDSLPQDSGISVTGEGIKRVLAGIDLSAAEVFAAKQLGFDCVAIHHPSGAFLADAGALAEKDHFNGMVRFGVSPVIAQKVVEGVRHDWERANHGRNLLALEQFARLLGIALISIHTPADIIVERALQQRFDALAAADPHLKLGALIDSLKEIREFKESSQPPEIWVGGSDSVAGKIVVFMTGVSAGGTDEYKAIIDAGAGTIVEMHMSKEICEFIQNDKRCNVVNTGHMASDSYGFNIILDAWESRGVEVTRIGGII